MFFATPSAAWLGRVHSAAVGTHEGRRSDLDVKPGATFAFSVQSNGKVAAALSDLTAFAHRRGVGNDAAIRFLSKGLVLTR